jgi:hypothetical protein
MTSIYPIIRKLKIMYSIVYEMQSMIQCADIPHGFAKGGLHPTLQELQKRGLPIKCLIHNRWKYNPECRDPSGRKQFWGIGKSQTVGVCYRIKVLWPETESAGLDHPDIRHEPFLKLFRILDFGMLVSEFHVKADRFDEPELSLTTAILFVNNILFDLHTD